MAFSTLKIPVIVGRNDTPTTTISQPEHPNGSYMVEKFNQTMDDLDTQFASTSPIDHIVLSNTVGKINTYTIFADVAELVNLGTFEVADGADGVDGADGTNGINGVDGVDGTNGINGIDGIDGHGIDHISLTNTIGKTKTYTMFGDVDESFNLGTFDLDDGADGADVDHVSLSNTVGKTKTYTLWADVGETINLGTFDVTDGADGTGDITSFVANTFTKAQSVQSVTLTFGTNIAVDGSQSNVFELTLTGDGTLENPTNLVSGQTLIFKIAQDVTGGRTLSFGSNYKFAGGNPPILSSNGNEVDILSCVAIGNDLYCSLVENFS